MIKKLLKVVEPRMEVRVSNEEIVGRLEGCGVGEVKNMRVYMVEEMKEKDVYLDVKEPLVMNGTVN